MFDALRLCFFALQESSSLREQLAPYLQLFGFEKRDTTTAPEPTTSQRLATSRAQQKSKKTDRDTSRVSLKPKEKEQEAQRKPTGQKAAVDQNKSIIKDSREQLKTRQDKTKIDQLNSEVQKLKDSLAKQHEQHAEEREQAVAAAGATTKLSCDLKHVVNLQNLSCSACMQSGM